MVVTEPTKYVRQLGALGGSNDCYVHEVSTEKALCEIESYAARSMLHGHCCLG